MRAFDKVIGLVPEARKQLIAKRLIIQQQLAQIDDALTALDIFVANKKNGSNKKNGAEKTNGTDKKNGTGRKAPAVQDKLLTALKNSRKPLTRAELVAATGLSDEQVYQSLHRLAPLKRVLKRGETFIHP